MALRTVAAVTGIKNAAPDTLRAFANVCDKLGCKLNNLAACIGFESGWNKSIVNRFTNATGFIQFMPNTAKSLGTTTDALSKMSGAEQMDFVYKYLLPFKGRLNSVEDCYLAIFWPNAVGKPDSYVIAQKDDPKTGKVFSQNPGMNEGNFITRKSATANVRKVLANAGDKFVNIPAASKVNVKLLLGSTVAACVGVATIHHFTKGRAA